MTNDRIMSLKQQLRDEVVEAMLEAIKDKAGIHLAEFDYDQLRNSLDSALIGRLRI